MAGIESYGHKEPGEDMRITSNMLVQQLAQAVKSEGVQKPEVGAVLSARIAQVLDGALTLDLGNGNLLTAKDLSGKEFKPGQAVSFMIADIEESGTLHIRPMHTDSAAAQEADSVTLMLKHLGLPDTADNRELLRALSAYRLPVTAENLKAAQEMNTQAKGIVLLSDQAGADILVGSEEVPLKEIAVKLIEMTASSGKEAFRQMAASEQAAGGAPGSVRTDQPSIVIESEVILENEAAPPRAADKPGPELKAGPPGEGEKAALPPDDDAGPLLVKPGNVDGNPRGAELKEILRQLTYEKITFALKHQLPHDMKTLESMEKLLAGKKDLSIQLEQLLGNIPDEGTGSSLRQLVREMGKTIQVTGEMDPAAFQQQLKALNRGLSSLTVQLMESAVGNPKLSESLEEVKNSLEFLGRLNESATYLHVPVALGQGTKPMDLYVQRDKSGKKQVNPKDTRIFISLETHNLDTVQCLAEVREAKLDIGFKVRNKEVLAHITGLFGSLKGSLGALGYTDIMIHGMVCEKPLNLLDVVQETPETIRRIDLRV